MTSQPTDIGDFLQHLAKQWPITCASGDDPLIKPGDVVTFSIFPTFAMTINDTVLTPTHAGLHSGDRMRVIDPILDCDMRQAADRARVAEAPPSDPEEFLQIDARHYEHVTQVFEIDGALVIVFAFVNVPDSADPRQDSIILKIADLRPGHGVSDNSVHGGPPG